MIRVRVHKTPSSFSERILALLGHPGEGPFLLARQVGRYGEKWVLHGVRQLPGIPATAGLGLYFRVRTA